MFNPVLLGTHLKKLRIKKSFSQDKLAEKADLSGKYLGEVERGNANISISNLSNLANVLEVSLMEILDYSHELPKSTEEIRAQLHDTIARADEDELIRLNRIIKAILD